VAAERGLDHDAVHRIAWDVLRFTTNAAEFSVADLDENEWDEVIAAILAAPIADEDVSVWAGTQAVTALDLDPKNPWPRIDVEAVVMFDGSKPEDLTPAQWREFGIRIDAQHPLP